MAVFHILEVNAAGSASGRFFRTQGLSLGILDPEIVYAVLPQVIVPGHIGRDNDIRSGTGCDSYRSGRIQTVAVLPHGLCDLRPLDVPLQPPFFVSNAPEDDGGVVAVPFDHTFQEPDMFLVYAGKAVLLQYQDTQTVTGIDHLRSHGVVAGTVGVDTQFLQFAEPVNLEGIRNAGTHAGMVLVHIYTFQFQPLTIEEETTVLVKDSLSEADNGFIAVHGLSFHQNLRPDLIQIRVRRAPEVGVFHFHLRNGRGVRLCRDNLSRHSDRPDHFSVLILQRVAEGIGRCGIGAIPDARFNGNIGIIISVREGAVDKSSERGHMDGIRDLQPDMPVDTGSFVEPSFLQGGIHADADQVLLSVIQVLGDVINLCGIPAGLTSQVEAVHPDARISENAVKTDGYVFPFLIGRDGEGFPVPAHAGLRILESHRLVSVAVTGLRSVGKVHHPVVREGYHLPAGRPFFLVKLGAVGALVMDGGGLRQIVEILCSAAKVQGWGRGISKGKFPVFVKTDTLARLSGVEDQDSREKEEEVTLHTQKTAYRDATRISLISFSVRGT